MNTKQIIDHPSYYGGEDNKYEAIKVIEAWKCGFHIGNVLKYLARAGKKNIYRDQGVEKITPMIEDLKKARWYLDRYIDLISNKEVSNIVPPSLDWQQNINTRNKK